MKREKGMEPEPNEPAPAEYLPVVCEGRWNEQGCTACPSYTWDVDQERSVSVSTPVALSLNGSHFGFNLEDCGHHIQHYISSVEIGRTENGWKISGAGWTDYSQCKNHITADTLFQACPSIEEGQGSKTHTMYVQSVRGFQHLLKVSDNLNACPEGSFTNQEFIGFNFVEGCIVIKYREGDYTTDPKDSCEQTLRSSQDVERRFCWNGDEFSEQ
ncbi:hypothetical protein FRD01_07855 [Microvenator marinus]|uniref:Uncharacterized protein n=1 Tax=Microvenator marinus TaxID=2600177 RepID=A0A5B8XQB8_9DELT|nr:hypothetical protein [Microvenator marinus]QED27158.1 hypothetical protein FRD01_07855 [Microvenator marinus]